jgi:predicted PurR-regulated permease PerM
MRSQTRVRPSAWALQDCSPPKNGKLAMSIEGSRAQSSQSVNALVSIAIVFFIVIALYWGQAVFIPLAMAIFFSFILTPVVIFLQKRGLGRVTSVIVVVAALLLTMGTVTLVVGQQMIHLTRDASRSCGSDQRQAVQSQGDVHGQ